MTRWFDTHVHLERYSPDEQRRLVREASAAGVAGMLAVSTSCASSRRTLGIERTGVLKAVGVHPTKAADGVCDELGLLAARDDVVAIGETGFDDAGPSFTEQRAAFRAQAALARVRALPVVLHIDGAQAWHELVAVEHELAGLPVVRHYFTGDEIQARWHLERGHYLSFGRPLLRNPRLQRIAATYSPDRVLIETDSYPLPGRATEPKHLVESGEFLATLRAWSVEQCAATLWQNSHRLLGLLAD